MPYKNRVKVFAENEIYHIYARGVNKIPIYSKEKDYKFFLYLLKKYLTPGYREKIVIGEQVVYKEIDSVAGKAELYCYTLIPNHFHMIIKNISVDGITLLSRRVFTTYSNYYNKEQKREGNLLQGSYRAIHIESEQQFINSSIYTHINSYKHKLVKKVKDYPYSSYHNYLTNTKLPWLTLDKSLLEDIDYNNIESYYHIAEEYEEKNL
ncbi:hypothetical protein COV24_04810 [candidate division WWE3 bacterium CG10_big_fil_rev_8_21_14_0_10_32_10]|uniref:Transposase IS200-like domain-containing protein n=1 Tax=candidate division WWE3 bacterium CG10_big_fil_rev_8_21_14_0_10_32_10 TaxID=1975090 RepID=A0A2H0R982_UNCKA|nr:MAG: hypothetical protein COV24_04810 [candidate division WWE3 bacterium CG10_big_fil_rev_8_21_14_0_10_32_10]